MAKSGIRRDSKHRVLRRGESIRWDAQYHTTCLPPHVLQQYGEIRNEPEDAAVPYGA